MTNVRLNKNHVAYLILAVGLSWLSMWLLSRYMLNQMFQGESLEILNNLLTNRGEHTPEYYFGRLEPAIAAAHLLLLILGALFLTRSYQNAWLWLALLLVGDSMLLAFHFGYNVPLLNIFVDRAIPEQFQYVKEVAIAAFLFAHYRASGQSVFLMFSIIAAYMFFDDAFKYHETVGHFLAPYIATTRWPQVLGSEPNFIGEILSLIPVLFVIPFGALSFFKANVRTRMQAFLLGTLIGALFIFGVVIDFLIHSSAVQSQRTRIITSIVEDFGEMVTMSLMLAYAANLAWKGVARNREQGAPLNNATA